MKTITKINYLTRSAGAYLTRPVVAAAVGAGAAALIGKAVPAVGGKVGMAVTGVITAALTEGVLYLGGNDPEQAASDCGHRVKDLESRWESADSETRTRIEKAYSESSGHTLFNGPHEVHAAASA